VSAPLLTIRDASVRFEKNYLFEQLSLTICEEDKIALVGRNGAGKTTLIRIVMRECEPESGERLEKPGLSVGYLSQDVSALPRTGTVFDYVSAGLKEENRTEECAYIAERAIHPLGIAPDDLMASLSGGQLRRAALARALAEAPDILLLDEPTNHLDIEAISWLEQYLAGYGGALLCISHDRAFLAGVTNKVFWLDRGKIRVCPKGFGHFEEWSAELLDQEARELHNREKSLAGELEWASRGPKARRKRNVRRLDMAASEKERLEKDQALYRRALKKIKVGKIETEDASRILAEFYRADKAFEANGKRTEILNKFSLKLMKDDRIGMIGRNGSGKTSFLKLLMGELEADAGTVKRAKNMTVSYFEQNATVQKPEITVQEVLCPEGGDYVNALGKERHVRGYLKDFMFDPKDADSPFFSLSGGQKNRLMLAKTLMKPGNLLILDEPTNDLDADTLDNLQEILASYPGALLIVSHDRDFLDRTVNKILSFEGNGVVECYTGGYSDYLAAKKRKSASPALAEAKPKAEEAPAAKRPNPQAGKLSYKVRRELEELPGKIAALEKEISALDEALADPGFYSRNPEGFDHAVRRYAEAKEELDAAETRWLELVEAEKG
jgi:ATP-binding cassette subfamily F protein uup